MKTSVQNAETQSLTKLTASAKIAKWLDTLPEEEKVSLLQSALESLPSVVRVEIITDKDLIEMERYESNYCRL